MSTNVATDLAARINEAHELATKSAASAVEHARRAGELLIEAKKSVGHGGWLQFCRDNVKFGIRSAQNYMRLAAQMPKLTEEKAQRVAHLPIRDALEQLCVSNAKLRSLDDQTREQVAAMVEQKETTVMTAAHAVRREQKLAKYRYTTGARVESAVKIDGRPLNIKRNENTRQWAVVLGKNEAGEQLEQSIGECKADPDYVAAVEEAEALEAKAKRLERELQGVRAQAKKRRGDAGEILLLLVRTTEGPIYAFNETLIFEPLPENLDAELKTLPKAELVTRLLQVGTIDKHDMQGDVGWMGLSHTLDVNAKWAGIGYEAGLA